MDIHLSQTRLEELAAEVEERRKNEYRRESPEGSLRAVVKDAQDVSELQRSHVEGLVAGIINDRKITRMSMRHPLKVRKDLDRCAPYSPGDSHD